MKLSSTLAVLAAGFSVIGSAQAFGSFEKWVAARQPIELEAGVTREIKDLLSPKVRAEFEKAVANLSARDKDSIIDPNGQLFDPEAQYVSVEGDHEWKAPGPGDTRGPCPGLNVLANHGYFNRDGTVGLTQAIEAVSQVYGISPDLGGVLSAYAVVFTGNILDGVWSVGGPFQSKELLGSVVNLVAGEPEGLNSHNVYEGDASVSRADFYANNGDDYTSQPEFFQQLVDLAGPHKDGDDAYTREVLSKHRSIRFNHSISTNPYFFFSAFGGLLVTTAAHDFIVNFMSNNTDDGTGHNRQYLDDANLLPFFSYERLANGTLKYTPGHERFPKNWLRRPIGAPYGLADVIVNLGRSAADDPRVLSIGGNTGKVNSFAGISVADLTGGTLNLLTLLDNKDALACYVYQATIEQVVPSQLKFIYKDITYALSIVADLIGRPHKALASKYNPCFEAVRADGVPAAYKKFKGSAVGEAQTNGLLGVVGDLLVGLGGLLGGSRRAIAMRVWG
ncbi:hypothetical protein A4X13_0g2051 [Tilletia indica]|uniref:Heme haloperoxidase family profile domain-containing protein n=1 Tax=Tilletia indica TaxID=43049 RepID=A0A177TI93_9BASI|nr:hypothetical protein A4X13_0g2051 [Tilletia indica]